MKRASMILTGIATVGIGSYVALGVAVRPPANTASTALSVAGDQAERGGDRPASSAEETAALRAGMAELHAEVAALRERMAESRASANAEAPAVSPEPARRDPEAIAQQARAWHEHMMDVDSDFEGEATDPRWASSTASTLESALNASDAMRGRVRGVECRSRTCRVEIAADEGSGAVLKELPILVQQLGETLPSMQADQVDDGSGHPTMVLYLARNDSARSPAAEASRR